MTHNPPHPLLHVTTGVTFHCCSRMPASWRGVMLRTRSGLMPPLTSASCMPGGAKSSGATSLQNACRQRQAADKCAGSRRGNHRALRCEALTRA